MVALGAIPEWIPRLIASNPASVTMACNSVPDQLGVEQQVL
jgi:hypothetical protein